MSDKARDLRSATFFKMEEIARWQALHQPIDKIAQMMNMSPDAVSRLVAHRDYKQVQARITGIIYGEVDKKIADRKASVMLEDAAPDAAATLISLLDVGLPPDRRQVATAILDRAGCGPIQKRAIRQRIEFDPMTMGLLRLALLESGQSGDDEDDFGDDASGSTEGQLEGTV